MSTRTVRVAARLGVLATIMAAAAAVPAGAQQAEAARAGAGCTYDTCALRRERVVWGERLLVGNTERRVRLRGFSYPLDSVFAGHERALAEAAIYRREARAGGLFSLLGLGLSVASILSIRDDCVDRDRCAWTGRSTALVLGGLTTTAIGGWRLQIADRQLNRAIWWYNRDLPR